MMTIQRMRYCHPKGALRQVFSERATEPMRGFVGGLVLGNEQCDDQNLSDGDGCSGECLLEPFWACDDASPSPCDGVRGYSMLRAQKHVMIKTQVTVMAARLQVSLKTLVL